MISISRDTPRGFLGYTLQFGESLGDGIQLLLRFLGLVAALLVRRSNIEDIVPNVELEIGSGINRLGAGGRGIMKDSTTRRTPSERSIWFGVFGVCRSRCRTPGVSIRGCDRWRFPFMLALPPSKRTVLEEVTLLLHRRLFNRLWRVCHWFTWGCRPAWWLYTRK